MVPPLLLLDLSLNILMSVLWEVISNPYLHKGHAFLLCCSSKRCHSRHNTNIPHDLSEKHTKGNMVLLYFSVKFVLEGLHLVKEHDFKKIHLFTHHHLI